MPARQPCCLGLVAICLLSRGMPAQDVRPSAYSMEQLRHRLRTTHDRIRAWYIEYQAASDTLEFYNHRILAAKHPHTCYFLGAKAPAGVDTRSGAIDQAWKEDAFQDWVLVTATDCWWAVPFSRQYWKYSYPQDSPLPQKLQTEFLFSAFGWWPFEKRPGPEIEGGGPCVIPDIVKSPKYSLRPQQEVCDGYWCHVVENPRRDTLWLDCERNCALVAREFLDAQTGATMQRLELRRHEEIVPGIWVPREIRNVHFDYHAQAPEGRSRRVLDAIITIIDVRVNDQVDDSIFEPKPMPPGALLMSRDHTYKQIVPAGFEHMDNLADWLNRTGRIAEPPASPRTAVWEYVVIAAAAGIVVAFGSKRRAGMRSWFKSKRHRHR